MRVNIYAEELTHRTEIVTKKVEGKTFYGIRLYLWFPGLGPFIHREGDDDSSAITFWVPWTKEKGNNFDALSSVLDDLMQEIKRAKVYDEVSPPLR